MLTYGTQTSIPGYTGDTAVLQVDPDDWFDIEAREPAVQDAVSIDFENTPVPKIIEIFANYVVVLSLSLGLLLLLLNRKTDPLLKITFVVLWLLILFTVAVPWLSMHYGGLRVYFTSLIATSIGFPVGVAWLAKKIRVPMIILCGIILLVYGLSTSGVIYQPFGMEKTFPVYYSLESLEVLP